MNNSDAEYLKLLDLLLTKGKLKKNRTNIDTLSIFGAQSRYDISDNFPLLTTKKVSFKNIAHELLWFLSGATNIKYLIDNNVHIWDDNAYDNYSKNFPKESGIIKLGGDFYGRALPKEEYIRLIKKDNDFAAKWGELGEGTYGSMFRKFPYAHTFSYEDDNREQSYRVTKTITKNIDQISKVIENLKNDPDSRRHIISVWHPYWSYQCCLSPCHILVQFNTEELNLEERAMAMPLNQNIKGSYRMIGNEFEKWLDLNNAPKYKLNCQFYMRSNDYYLGAPYNIASYALLTYMIAQITNMVPGELIHSIGDLHLYVNHKDQAKIQLTRQPLDSPTLKLNKKIDNIFQFKYEDFELINYQFHPAIKAEMAV